MICRLEIITGEEKKNWSLSLTWDLVAQDTTWPLYFSLALHLQTKPKFNLDKLGDGLDESPTVMVGEDNKTKQNSVKIGAY